MTKIIFRHHLGKRAVVEAKDGLTILEVAKRNDIEIQGTCGGNMVCGTCHVTFDLKNYARLKNPDTEEEAVLEYISGSIKTSRLGCQILISEELDGLEVLLPPGI